ncbi:surfactin synthase subunit 1 [Kroppenstedtia guangzhouensis]|uniref:Surfactin synthase subunit 1 n=1 Tax=Kroppenstedtia guangzhouensis TaxID=1274356 RepID=A0ABQ1G635_9BACL|nr:surfactin synthase subunit 1 [Kroppenstedtia guangzhouensis]
MTASTLELVKEEVTDWKQVVSDLYGWVEKLLVDRQIFSQMRLFAEQLATSFDMRRETEGFPHFTEVPLFSELGHVADGRVKFAQMLSFLGKHVHPGFQDVSESMKKSAANWGVIRGTLIKMHLTGVVTAETLGKTVERIKLAADAEEQLAGRFLEFISSLRGGDGEKTVWTTSAAEAVSAYVEPAGEMETRLARLWKQVLGKERVGALDHFFELGGQSLQALASVSLLKKEYGLEVPVSLIFQYPTIRELAAVLEEKSMRPFQGLEPVGVREYYPVTSQQKRIYLLQQFSGADTGYNIPSAMVIRFAVDADRLETALQQLAARHEALRTTFHLIDGEPKQRIENQVEIRLQRMDISDFTGDTEQERIQAAVADFVRPFVLDQGPLARFALMRMGEERYLFLADLHHIIADGVSLEILNRECMALYREESLPLLPWQYKEYAVWQEKQLQTEAMCEQESYWLQALQGIPPGLNFPTDFPRPAKQTFAGRRLTFTVPADVTVGINRLAVKTGSTPYMVLLALYSVLIAAYTRERDVVVGSPITGRSHADVESVIGMFVNTLVMRNRVEPEQTFTQFLRQVKKTALEAYENQDFPFDLLVEKLNIERDLSRNPVFDTMFVMQNMEALDPAVEGIPFTPYEFDHGVSKFDLSMELTERNGELHGCLDYRRDLFLQSSMELFIQHFQELLRSATTNPHAKIADLALMSEAEKKQLLQTERARVKDVQWPENATLHELFQEQVRRFPDAEAVVCGDERLTYRELNAKADRVAHVLRMSGVGAECLVAVMMERSVEMIAVLLGVLKAGGAYLPIDPDYPEERVSFMLEDSQTKWLVTQRLHGQKVDFPGEVFYAEELFAGKEPSEGIIPAPTKVRPENLAYVTYTSGTTGRPKGVMIEHRHVVQLLVQTPGKFKFTEADVWMMFHSFCFDVSVWEMYSALLHGGSLVIVPKDVARDPQAFAELVSRERVTVLNQTPSAFYSFEQAVERSHLDFSLRFVIFAGEALKPGLLKGWKKRFPQVRLINMYGITETTVYVTFKEIGEREIRNNLSNIGTPLPTYKCIVCDEWGRPVPKGVPGELYIGGAGIARGYLNRPELTEERFVEHPDFPGERLYKSGDLVRLQPDGELEYCGRIDQQVKIRGYRIETSEIEVLLMQHEQVQEAAVVAIADDMGVQELCAYVVADEEVNLADLRGHLAHELPSYMIPSAFVRLEKIPLTPNGKMDHRALPKPDVNMQSGTAYIPPADQVEEELVALWQEVLRAERIGVEDDFFTLGGHSLNAAVLTAEISKRLGVQVPLRQFFQTPTIRALAKVIRHADKRMSEEISPAPKAELYPVSSSQKRMILLQDMDGVQLTYHLPSCFILEGPVDTTRIESAFRALIKRHEILRTQFEWQGDQVMQRVLEEVPFELEQMQGSLESWMRPFDLSQAPLVRAGLQKLDADRHLMVVDMHHIITDGVSMATLVSDLVKLYSGESLPEMRLQYRDYAVWEQKLLNSEAIRRHEKFWKEQFAKGVPVLELPYDRPRPPVKSFAGGLLEFRADASLSERVKQLALETDTTPFMVLMGAFTVLLYKHGGQREVVVGSPVAGRPHADLFPLIGMFVNTLALRYHMEPEQTFAAYLQDVKEWTLAAFEHQIYPFDQLVEELDLPRDMSRSALFDVMFVLQNMEEPELQGEGITIHPQPADTRTSKFDLTLAAEERPDGFAFTFEYATALFDRETMEKWSRRLLRLLEQVTQNRDVPLQDLEILAEEEKRAILAPSFAPHPSRESEGMTVHAKFEEMVRKQPDAKALVCGSEQLTYAQLNAKANKVATVLRQKGVQPDQTVGVMTKRSTDLVAALLGVLKAGAAYVPVDPEYPPERIGYILKDSEAKCLVIQQELYQEMQGALEYDGQVVFVEEAVRAAGEAETQPPVSEPHHLAYVIYTSGTTGQPKGVAVEHRHLLEVILSLPKEDFRFGPGDVWTAFHSVGFDFSVWEIFGCLLTGGKLVVVHRDTARDTSAFLELLRSERVTVLSQTPSAFYALSSLEACGDPTLCVHTVLLGGEALKSSSLAVWKKRYADCRLINMYGITETTIVGTYKNIGSREIENNESAIGQPFPPYTCYVLDENKRLVPPGTPGELYIGGRAVARGYVNRPELTAERFIPHPYNPAERVYRTGDLVRVRQNGDLEYLGRVDQQVKIRGYRIEISEIEHHLQAHDQALEAIVQPFVNDSGEMELCAYVVMESQVSLSEWREYLAQRLPMYMIPAYFVQLEKIPLTPNGKVDRRALPKPDPSKRLETFFVAPADHLEKELVKLWQDALDLERMGVEDDFFAIGGHSLKATMLIAQIHERFDVKVPLRQLFLTPTVRGIAQYIRRAEPHRFASIGQAPKAETYPVSSAQKRLLLLHELEGADTSYNMPAVYLLEGPLNRERVETAFRGLIERHESLRTSLVWREGEPVQIISEEIQFSLEEIPAQEVNEAVKGWVRSFDLSQAPLFRAGLMPLDDERHLLLLDMHHIISDGLSMNILIRDFAALYAGKKLPPLRLQYKDYAVWQQEQLTTQGMVEQEQFWLDQFAEGVPVLELATDHPRPATKSFEGRWWECEADTELTAKVKQLAQETGTTLYMVLLAAFYALLHKHSGQEDMVIGSPVAGRAHGDLAPILGMFVNTLAIRQRPKGEKPFSHFLQEVKEGVLAAQEHQDYPFDLLVSRLPLNRDMSRQALFDVLFVLQNLDMPEVGEVLDGLTISSVKFEHTTSKFDLSLTVEEQDDKLMFGFEYATALFEEATVDSLGSRFLRLLEEVTRDPHVRLADIQLLTPEEEKFLMTGMQLKEPEETEADFDWDFGETEPAVTTIHRRFEAQLWSTPDRVAVKCGEVSLTYRELDRLANGLAHELRAKGVAADQRVAVVMDRSVEMIAAMLGVLKAGGAYVPIDPDYPQERIEFTLRDSGAGWLVMQESLAEHVSFSGEKLFIEKVVPADEAPEVDVREDHLCYVIYTSGTTGHPKGVMIEHRNLLSVMDRLSGEFGFRPGDIWTQFHSIGFDFSVFEIYGALLTGGTLVIVPKEITRDTPGFLRLVREEGITVLGQTPSAFYALSEWEQKGAPDLNVRVMIFGGERLKPSLLRSWKTRYSDCRLFNAYGITETTIVGADKEIDWNEIEHNISSIGHPYPDYTCYVFDQHMRPVLPGVSGELYIGGPGVARGYINLPKLTAERFIANPYCTKERLYKSGDLVRLLPNGEMEYLGRIDHQVKVRGHRIEPGEIERCLQMHENVREAVVLATEDQSGMAELCAYLVASPELSIPELRVYVSEHLPGYMIPTHYILLERMPLTVNGKVDRRALPQPDPSSLRKASYEAPANTLEEQLAAIWKEVLHLERVGVEDDFFLIGGHSLRAVKMTALVYERLGWEISLRDLYEQPTIRRLATRLEFGEKKRQPLVCLNGTSERLQAGRTLFAFPPLGGDAYTFKAMAAYLTDIHLYGFDFIQEDDRIAQYVRYITSVQPEGAYTLLGYSAGGSLAYETAVALEAAGLKVAGLILMDSVPDGGTIDREWDENQLLRLAEHHLEGVADWVRQPSLRQKVLKEMKRYLDSYANTNYQRPIQADIHLIRSLDGTPGSPIWPELTKGTFEESPGAGSHFTMLQGEALAHNAKRVRQIAGTWMHSC